MLNNINRATELIQMNKKWWAEQMLRYVESNKNDIEKLRADLHNLKEDAEYKKAKEQLQRGWTYTPPQPKPKEQRPTFTQKIDSSLNSPQHTQTLNTMRWMLKNEEYIKLRNYYDKILRENAEDTALIDFLRNNQDSKQIIESCNAELHKIALIDMKTIKEKHKRAIDKGYNNDTRKKAYNDILNIDIKLKRCKYLESYLDSETKDILSKSKAELESLEKLVKSQGMSR